MGAAVHWAKPKPKPGPENLTTHTMFAGLKHLKYYNVPILKPLWPVFIGAGVTFYAFGKAAESMSQAPEYINDPRNPYVSKKHD